MSRAWRPGACRLALVLLASGCTYYPTVRDVGGVRLRPDQGRVVRAATDGEAVLSGLTCTLSPAEVVIVALQLVKS